MGYNVPDDWDCYWQKCELCGKQYHKSEGYCGCADYLEEQTCKCGEKEWHNDGTGIYCQLCWAQPGTPLGCNKAVTKETVDKSAFPAKHAECGGAIEVYANVDVWDSK
jgi:hypothetical protein